MVVLNDLGLTLEILGFIIFLFVPITESSGWLLEKLGKIEGFFYKHKSLKKFLRYFGIGLIILGLIMQYGFLQ